MRPRRFDARAFIGTVTDEIWNRRLLGNISDYFAADVVVRALGRPPDYGSDLVAADATRRLAAFPDGRVFVADVVASGDDGRSYLVSERRTFVGRNDGSSVYGPATGRRIVVEEIVNYRIAGGHIVEMWAEHDELTVVHDLGFDERVVLRERSEELAAGVPAYGTAANERVERTADAAAGVGSDAERLVHAVLAEAWNGRSVGRIGEYLAGSYRGHGPGRRELFGRDDYASDVLSLVATFPDLTLHVDHHLSAGDGGRARTSTAWTMLGTHRGPGPYGPPDGRRVRVTGISNHLVEDGRIVEEWRQYNELALLRQLVRLPGPEADDTFRDAEAEHGTAEP